MSSQVKTMSTLTCPCVLIKCLHNLKKMLNRSVNRMFDMTAVPGLCVLLLSSFPTFVKHHDRTDQFQHRRHDICSQFITQGCK